MDIDGSHSQCPGPGDISILCIGIYLEENILLVNLKRRAIDLNTKIISRINPYDNGSSGCRNLQ
jgi:hypothetical protein